MSLAEIEAEITRVARDGEGPDKFRALKLLTNMRNAGASVPAPMTDSEICKHLVPLMAAAGHKNVVTSYAKAFQTTRKPVPGTITDHETIASEKSLQLARHIDTVRKFNRAFPGLCFGNGMPRGYPRGKSLEEQQKWLYKTALKIYVGREQRATEVEISRQEALDADPGPEAPATDD